MSDTVRTIDKGYMPYNILRAIYQTVFMIHKVLIVHHETSLPVYERDIEFSGQYDSAMISGILQAISSIGQEMIGRPTGFKKLMFHGFVVTGAYFEGFSIYVFSETELVKEIELGMQDLIKWFSITFSSQKDNWDGSLDVFKISKSIIKSKMSQNLYLWLLYPLQSSKNQNLDISSLSGTSNDILECVKLGKKCTTARIIDYFRNRNEDEILFEIFNLAINGFIEISNDD